MAKRVTGQSTPASCANSLTTKNQLAGIRPAATALDSDGAPTPKRFANLARPSASKSSEMVMAPLFTPCESLQVHNCRIAAGLRPTYPSGDMAELPQYLEIGNRLRMLRDGLRLSQREMCRLHGFQPPQYNNWEKGHRRISLDCALRLSAAYGLTLDWIYLGRRDGLSQNALRILGSNESA